jgi:hypothetical protein
MTVRNAALLAGTFVMAVQCVAALFGIELSAFAPAFYDAGSVGGHPSKLHVFPLDGLSFTLALPFQVGELARQSGRQSALWAKIF